MRFRLRRDPHFNDNVPVAVECPRESRQTPRSRRGNEAAGVLGWSWWYYVGGCAALTSLCLLVPIESQAQRSSNWRGYKVADGLAETASRSITMGAQGKILVTHPSVPLITILDGY